MPLSTLYPLNSPHIESKLRDVPYAQFDSLDIAQAHYLWCSENHGGQGSEAYERLSRIGRFFKPGPCWKGWESLSPNARNIYRQICIRDGEKCEYDTLGWWARNDELCYLRGDYAELIDALLEETYNAGVDRNSDWINDVMPYCRDLTFFYDAHEDELKAALDEQMSQYGHTSLMEHLEGETIEDVDDLKAAIVNRVMTRLSEDLMQAFDNYLEEEGLA
jgi:hypothetical protein